MQQLKKIQHKCEYFLFKYFLFIFALLPYRLSGSLASFLLASLSYLFGANKIAKKNLEMVFPNHSRVQINKIRQESWENLGRNFAEYAHFTKMKPNEIRKKVNIKGKAYLEELLKKNERVIFFTAHYSNWELSSLILAIEGFKMNGIYRPANNSYIDKKVNLARKTNLNVSLHPKSRVGSISFVKAIKAGESGGILIDQKYRKGVKVSFFGKKAYSSTFIVNIAKKYKVSLVPAHIERLKNGDFEFIVEKPITAESIERKTDKQILLKLNKILEKWIKRNPGQWFWVHNRWG